MMGAAFGREPRPSFWRPLASIESVPGRHPVGMLQTTGAALVVAIDMHRRITEFC